ncbi:hypothetical protein HDV05_006580, partial [Chytridiales sp. JEL 0842]
NVDVQANLRKKVFPWLEELERTAKLVWDGSEFTTMKFLEAIHTFREIILQDIASLLVNGHIQRDHPILSDPLFSTPEFDQLLERVKEAESAPIVHPANIHGSSSAPSRLDAAPEIMLLFQQQSQVFQSQQKAVELLSKKVDLLTNTIETMVSSHQFSTPPSRLNRSPPIAPASPTLTTPLRTRAPAVSRPQTAVATSTIADTPDADRQASRKRTAEQRTDASSKKARVEQEGAAVINFGSSRSPANAETPAEDPSERSISTKHPHLTTASVRIRNEFDYCYIPPRSTASDLPDITVPPLGNITSATAFHTLFHGNLGDGIPNLSQVAVAHANRVYTKRKGGKDWFYKANKLDGVIQKAIELNVGKTRAETLSFLDQYVEKHPSIMVLLSSTCKEYMAGCMASSKLQDIVTPALQDMLNSVGLPYSGRSKAQMAEELATHLQKFADAGEPTEILSWDVGMRYLAYAYIVLGIRLEEWGVIDILNGDDKAVKVQDISQAMCNHVSTILENVTVLDGASTNIHPLYALVEQQRAKTNGGPIHGAILNNSVAEGALHTILQLRPNSHYVQSTHGFLTPNTLTQAITPINPCKHFGINSKRSTTKKNVKDNLIKAVTTMIDGAEVGGGSGWLQSPVDRRNLVSIRPAQIDMFKGANKKDDLADALMQALAGRDWLAATRALYQMFCWDEGDQEGEVGKRVEDGEKVEQDD